MHLNTTDARVKEVANEGNPQAIGHFHYARLQSSPSNDNYLCAMEFTTIQLKNRITGSGIRSSYKQEESRGVGPYTMVGVMIVDCASPHDGECTGTW